MGPVAAGLHDTGLMSYAKLLMAMTDEDMCRNEAMQRKERMTETVEMVLYTNWS